MARRPHDTLAVTPEAPRDILLHDVEVGGVRTDVAVRRGRIVAVQPGLVAGSADVNVVDGEGGALIPGLHDHHLHLLAAAAALSSVDLTGAGEAWPTRIQQAAPDASGWVRVVGHHDPGLDGLDRWMLDRVRDDVPVRVQHRGGALWSLNSKALRLLPPPTTAGEHIGVERDDTGKRTGRVWRRDDLIRKAGGSALPDLTSLQDRLRALGVTGVTDASPDLDPDALVHVSTSLSTGRSQLRLLLLSGKVPPGLGDWARVGPRKIVLNDHEMPDAQALRDAVTASHEEGRAVALHCVSRTSLVLALWALTSAGSMSKDRIEHGSVVPPELADWIADLGVRVVTQPVLMRDRGDDYLDTVDPHDRDHLYPYARLLAKGVKIAPSSDAPYGDLDPWAAMRAGRDRLSANGRRIGADEGIPVRLMLRGFLSRPEDPGGFPRRVAVSEPADLCLLRAPLDEALAQCSADVVRATWVGGR